MTTHILSEFRGRRRGPDPLIIPCASNRSVIFYLQMWEKIRSCEVGKSDLISETKTSLRDRQTDEQTDGRTVSDRRRSGHPTSRRRCRLLLITPDTRPNIYNSSRREHTLLLTQSGWSWSIATDIDKPRLVLTIRATNRYTPMRSLVHWPLMGGLLHLVQQGGAWAGCGPAHQRPMYQLHIVGCSSIIMPLHCKGLKIAAVLIT